MIIFLQSFPRFSVVSEYSFLIFTFILSCSFLIAFTIVSLSSLNTLSRVSPNSYLRNCRGLLLAQPYTIIYTH